MSVRKDRLRATFHFKKRPDVSREEFEQYLLRQLEDMKALPIIGQKFLKFDYTFRENLAPESGLHGIVNETGGTITSEGLGDFCVLVEVESFELLAEFMNDPGFRKHMEEGFDKAYDRGYQVFTSRIAPGFE